MNKMEEMPPFLDFPPIHYLYQQITSAIPAWDLEFEKLEFIL
jgi:hypothetical protein